MLKQLKRNAVIAWSPIADIPNYLALGTAAGTVGDFNTSTEVEIASLTTADAQDIFMPILGTAETTEKLHSIKWGKGVASGPYEHGIIAGALANGSVSIWNPSVLMGLRAGEGQSAVLSTTDKHSGAVLTLDFNPNQPNLLASGGPNSEIFIWDVGNPTAPKTYTPGAKVSAESDITCVEWNKKVQHILASTAFNGVTTVWDLRAKRPLLTFSDPNKKLRCRAMTWNPAEPTQLATASEDDSLPVIQLWDLRNTFSPTKYLEGHTKGIWSLSWSAMDTNLLLSCGKGNEVFCWNVETAKVRCQVETTNSWNSQVEWSPCVPAVLATCSMEGQVKVFSLHDPTPKAVPSRGSLKNVDFSAPPKWLKRPAGAAFGFGGKLASFSSNPGEGARTVVVRTIITDQTFVDRAQRLEDALKSNDCKPFCEEKINNSADEQEKAEWSLLKVLFGSNTRKQLLDHLGFSPEGTKEKVNEFISQLPDRADDNNEAEHAKEEETEEDEKEAKAKDNEESTKEHARKEGEDEADASALFGGPPSAATSEAEDVSNLFGSSGGSANDSLFGAPPPSEGGDLFSSLGQAADDDPFAQIAASAMSTTTATSQTTDSTSAAKNLARALSPKATIKFDLAEDSPENAIARALIVGNFEAAVDCCLKIGRTADALVLAACGGTELWSKTQDTYLASQRTPFMKLVSSIAKSDLQALVAQTELGSWKGALAVLCTYAKSEEFPILCDFLASRLESAGNTQSAILCYICAGNIDKAVRSWVNSSSEKGNDSLASLLEVMEKVSIFRRAIDYNEVSDILAAKYSQYAEALASQGKLDAAMHYLSQLNDSQQGQQGAAGRATILLHRVASALNQRPGISVPSPFQTEAVRSEQAGTSQQQQQVPGRYQQFGSATQHRPGGFQPSQPGPIPGPRPMPPQQLSGPSPQPVGQPPRPQPAGPSLHPSGPSRHPAGPSPHPSGPSPHPAGPSPHPAGPSPHPSGPSPHSAGPSPFPSNPPHRPTPMGPSQPPQTPTPVSAAAPQQTGGAYIPPAALAAGYTSLQTGASAFPTGPLAPPTSSPSGSAPAPSPSFSAGPGSSGGAISVFPSPPAVFNPAAASGGGAAPTIFTPTAPALVGGERPPTVFTPTAPGSSTPPSSAPTPTVFTPTASKSPSPPTSSGREAAAPAPPPKVSKEPTALSGEIVTKFSSIVETLSQRLEQDPRKSRAIADARTRMNEMYGKLKTGQYSDELETLLNEFAIALETHDKANVNKVHKVLATNHWDDLGSKVMIGIKRVMDNAL